MAKPSLSASSQGQQMAAQSLKLAKLTKKGLAERVGCSRQPVTNFFKGVAIEQPLFVDLCDRLNLDWQVVAGLPTPANTQTASTAQSTIDSLPLSDSNESVESLVQRLRQTAYDSLQERCGTMRVLDMSRPMTLNEIYTNVNILEKISRYQWHDMDELIASVTADDFDRVGFGQVAQAHVSAIAAVAQYQKLIVLGKPGAGKTTFLKHLAIQCIEGHFEADRLPLFVNLKHFSEQPEQIGLLDFISQRHLKSRLTALSLAEVEDQRRLLKRVLNAGQALILLDGLDEVNAANHERVLREVRVLSEECAHNHFLMTCRIAAWEYTFEQFTEVEIADFDWPQIETFSEQWFLLKPQSALAFLRSLNQRPQLGELASTPLLLTLLCLAFEASGSLPNSRSDLYRESIEILLKKWDASRGIYRDQVYRRLSVKRKEDLLSQIALSTFELGHYFFKQAQVEQSITAYTRNLPEASEDPEVLQLDSTAILHSIEAQHGLLVERFKQHYSFSHLTFHEYFVARELVFNSSNLKAAMRELIRKYALVPQWREVFLLASELLRDADLLLTPLLQQAHTLLAAIPKLQDFLAEIDQQASSPCFEGVKPAAVRAFLFDIDFDIDNERQVAIRLDRSANWLVCASFLTRMLDGVDFEAVIAQVKDYDQQTGDEGKIAQVSSANEAMRIAMAIAQNSAQIKPDLKQKLRKIYNPADAALDEDQTKAVADAGRQMAKGRLHMGKDAKFNATEQSLLTAYYRMIHLLVDCLYSDGSMLDPRRRQAIEQALFVPQTMLQDSPPDSALAD